MQRNLKRILLLAVPVALIVIGPAVASAQTRPRRAVNRVVVRGGPYFYRPYFYRPFFYSPFWDPWFGGGWGYPYPVGAFRVGPVPASLRLDVKPRDAQVYVDGYYAGIVDNFDGALQRLNVLPGQHEIVVYKEGYRSLTERLYLGPDSSRKVTHDLVPLAAGEPNDPLPQPAERPAGADAPPDAANRQGLGRYPPSRPRGTVSAAPARESRTGSVAIRVQPEGAEVTIDGERWTSGSEDERLIVQLSEGAHQVEVSKAGYQSVVLDVDVRGGVTTPVNVNLSRD